MDTSPVRVHPAAEPIGIMVLAAGITIPIVTSRWAQALARAALRTLVGEHGSTVLAAALMGWVGLICLVTALALGLPDDTGLRPVQPVSSPVSAGQSPCRTVFQDRHPNTGLHGSSTGPRTGRNTGLNTVRQVRVGPHVTAPAARVAAKDVGPFRPATRQRPHASPQP